MDFFNEYIVKKQKNAADFAKIAGIILGGLVLIFILMLFMRFVGSLFLLLAAAVIYGMYYFISSQSIEFEYIVTNGELDIDKIIARRRRKRLVSVDSKDFEYFAPYSEKYSREYSAQDINKKINAAGTLNADNVFFAVYHKNNEKICLIFQPTEKMVKEFSLRTPRSVFFTE